MDKSHGCIKENEWGVINTRIDNVEAKVDEHDGKIDDLTASSNRFNVVIESLEKLTSKLQDQNSVLTEFMNQFKGRDKIKIWFFSVIGSLTVAVLVKLLLK